MNNIIVLMNEFPKLDVFRTTDIIKGFKNNHNRNNNNKPIPTPVDRNTVQPELTVNHISINSNILSYASALTRCSGENLNKSYVFNNIVVIFDGVVTNKPELENMLGDNNPFFATTAPDLSVEFLVANLYCKYGFTETIGAMEGCFSIILIDKRTDDVVKDPAKFRKVYSCANANSVEELKKLRVSSPSPSCDTSKLDEPKIECEDIIGSKIYISREKSGITSLFTIIVSADGRDSFMVTNNYNSVIKTEQELSAKKYKFKTVKMVAGCYTVLTHDRFVFSRWMTDTINCPYYMNSCVEKYDGITTDYINEYNNSFYECVSESVNHAITLNSEVGCLFTNTVESRVIFETLKKYYSNNKNLRKKRFYVYYMNFEESANDPYYNYNLSGISDDLDTNTFIRTNIVIPSVHSNSMKSSVIEVVDNMFHLYSYEFMRGFLEDTVIQTLLGEPADIKIQDNYPKSSGSEYYVNILKINIGYFYLSWHISQNMPSIKTLFLPIGSRFMSNDFARSTAMFDRTTYNKYCKSCLNCMDSGEGLRANLYLFSKNIRTVCPFADRRITDLFFSLSKSYRFSSLKKTGIVGNTLLTFMEYVDIFYGTKIHVKIPDNFLLGDENTVSECKILDNTTDDIIY
jgi:hypothetical protein